MDAVDVLAAGDRAVARVTVSGTQTGDFMEIAASGRHAEVDLIDLMRFDDSGLVCEHWGVADMLSLLQQLGVLPQGAATVRVGPSGAAPLPRREQVETLDGTVRSP